MTREEAIEKLELMRQKVDEETYRALILAIKALSQEPTEKPMTVDEMEREYEKSKALFHKIVECDDAISREDALKLIYDFKEKHTEDREKHPINYGTLLDLIRLIRELPSVTQKSGKWIPVSERLPEDLEPVNITWVNHNPERYYEEFKDKPFTATGHYCKGRWYWYSCTCQDYLEEYGRCDFDEIDTDIEVIAWKPLPEPYEPQESEE